MLLENLPQGCTDKSEAPAYRPWQHGEIQTPYIWPRGETWEWISWETSGYCLTHVLTQGRELVLWILSAHMTVHSLELHDDLSGLPCQITQIPVAIEVGNQPVTKRGKCYHMNQQIAQFNFDPGFQRYKWPTWLSALHRLWAGRILLCFWRPTRCDPWRSSSRPPPCFSLALCPGAPRDIFTSVQPFYIYIYTVNKCVTKWK